MVGQWRLRLETYAQPIARRKVSDVDTAGVLRCLKNIWEEKPETASRVRGRIERVLDYAKVKGWREGENPARWRGHLALMLPKPEKLTRGHHAAMDRRELPAFMDDLAGRDGMAPLALRFLILTAARVGEVIGATWDEIDLDGPDGRGWAAWTNAWNGASMTRSRPMRWIV